MFYISLIHRASGTYSVVAGGKSTDFSIEITFCTRAGGDRCRHNCVPVFFAYFHLDSAIDGGVGEFRFFQKSCTGDEGKTFHFGFKRFDPEHLSGNKVGGSGGKGVDKIHPLMDIMIPCFHGDGGSKTDHIAPGTVGSAVTHETQGLFFVASHVEGGDEFGGDAGTA